ncbi:MAG: hypothetical protein HDT18_03555 [Oscillibacter sp.]|nr:hypothetical protein [Oscillibacter sp.]
MKGNKPIIIAGFVLYGLTIVFWIALCVRSLLRGRVDLSLFLGAALWIIWFAALLRRYLGREKDEEE